MRHIVFSLAGWMALAALALAVSSCSGGQGNNGIGGQKGSEIAEFQKGITLELKTVYSDEPKEMEARIFPDSIVVVSDNISHTYIIDKEKSFENVVTTSYHWNFVVSGKGEGCPPCDTITVEQYMTDLYGEMSEWDFNRLILHSRENSQYCRIINELAIPRQLFANYPVSKPFPELVMDEAKFYNIFNLDTAKIPPFLLTVNRVVIKENNIIFSDGEKTTTLEILPLSDYENVYSEGYNWNFITKETEFAPRLAIHLNAGFDFERRLYKPEERWIALFVNDIGEIQFKFKSWDNLKRMISVSYPSEQEFQTTMEEGIYPDYSDEE